jgi:WD40 repeat protein
MSVLFISYAHPDAAVALEVRDGLARLGFQSLFLDAHATDGIPAGAPWEQELHRQLRRSDAVIALCSRDFTASRWCFAEMTFAKATGKVIIPAQLDASPRHELLADIQSVDLTHRAQDAGLTYAAVGHALALRGIRAHRGGPWVGERSPYPGLATFEEGDAPVFFGREDDVNEALAHLRRIRAPEAAWLAILGASGCGKSSLLRAGLVPQLRADAASWVVVDPFRPGAQPLTRLAQALAQAFERYHGPTDWKGIRSTLLSREANALRDLGEDMRFCARAGEARVLLIVDQLEEALLPLEAGADGAREDPAQLMGLLRQLIELPGTPFLIVCTLRSDFLGDFQTHEAARGLGFATLMLGPLSDAGFERVIRGPAELAHLELEDGLTELMVRDTATTDALPLLAFALRELYENHGQDRQLTIEEYRQDPPAGIGGLQGALAQAAEDVLARQSPAVTGAVMNALRNSFLSMVALRESGQPARRPARWQELPGDAHALLEQLVKARLLVSRDNGGQREVEVAHEALFRSWRRLSIWIAENGRFLAWRKELETRVQTWRPADPRAALDARFRGRAPLLLEDDLVRARTHLKQDGELMNADERGFVRASIAADRRRRWFVRAVVGGTIAILSAATVFARHESVRATERTAAAKRATLLAAARLLAKDPTREGALLRETSAENWQSGQITSRTRGGITARILEGHGKAVRSVAFSPDGTRILTGSEDGTARIWSVDDSRTSVVLSGHQGAVVVAAFDPTGTRVLTASDDMTARIWRADGTGQPQELRGHGDPIDLAAFSPDGKLVLTAARRPFDLDFGPPDNTARLWDPERPTEPRLLQGHTATISAASFSQDGSRVATASKDKTTRIWKTQGTDPPVVLQDPDGQAVVAVTLSSDAALVATGAPDGLIRVWHADGSGKPRALAGHTGAITVLAFGPEDRQLISGSEDGTARVWTLEAPAGSTTPLTLNGHTSVVTTLALSPDGKQLATASADGTARIWNLDGTRTDPFSGILAILPEDWLNAFARSNSLFQTGLDSAHRLADESLELSGHDARVTALAWSPDGHRIATASADGTARVWQLDEPRRLVSFRNPAGGQSWCALSRDGELLLVRDGGGAFVRHADGSGDPVSIGMDGIHVDAAGFSADARRVVTASADKIARIWSIEGARPVALAQQRNLPDAVNAVFFDPGGKRVVAVSSREVWFWTPGDSGPAVTRTPIPDVRFAAFAGDGDRLLVQTSVDIQFWDADGSLPRGRLVPPERTNKPGDPPWWNREPRMSGGFRLTADGTHLIACGQKRGDGDAQPYLRWRLHGDRSHVDLLPGYRYNFLTDSLEGEGRETLPLAGDGTPASGNPCWGDFQLPFARSPNGRRFAASMDLGLVDKTKGSLIFASVLDERTYRWRVIDHCLSTSDRMRLLSESAAEADTGLRCCRATMSACRKSTFDACETLVAKNYADSLNPCAEN